MSDNERDQLVRSLMNVSVQDLEGAVDLIDSESVRDEAPSPEPWDAYGETRETVTLEVTVEETIHYPATLTLPAAEFEDLRNAGVSKYVAGLHLAAEWGARIVVNERHGDVQGQRVIGIAE